MEITWFEWDDNNIEHIARHDVTPDEVEGVAFDDEPWIKKVAREFGICLVIQYQDDIFVVILGQEK
jgi:hypothetical protein